MTEPMTPEKWLSTWPKVLSDQERHLRRAKGKNDEPVSGEWMARDFRAAVAHAVGEEREACARIAEATRGGFTAVIGRQLGEPELVRDHDGPWVLNTDIAAAIRARWQEPPQEETP